MAEAAALMFTKNSYYGKNQFGVFMEELDDYQEHF
jgi:hypothetical protein